jgi:hypothetical protein
MRVRDREIVAGMGMAAKEPPARTGTEGWRPTVRRKQEEVASTTTDGGRLPLQTRHQRSKRLQKNKIRAS